MLHRALKFTEVNKKHGVLYCSNWGFVGILLKATLLPPKEISYKTVNPFLSAICYKEILDIYRDSST